MSDGAGFDSLTDKSGQGAKVSDDDIWKAITEVASGGCGVEEVRAIAVPEAPAFVAELDRVAALARTAGGTDDNLLVSATIKWAQGCQVDLIGSPTEPGLDKERRTAALALSLLETKQVADDCVVDPLYRVQVESERARLRGVITGEASSEAEDKRQPFGKAMSYSSLVESVHAMLRENPGRAVLPKRLWPGPGMVTEVPAGEIVTRPAELTTTNVRLPDGRMLDDVLAENTKMKAQLAAYLCAPQAHGITVEPPPADEQDLGTLSDDDMMAACGADGVAWARAFCQILDRRAKNGPVHLDRDGMATWFVSAIETAAATRHNQAQTIYAPGKGWPFHWVMREDGPQLWMTNGHGDWWQAAMDRLAVPTLTCTQMAARELPSGYMGPAYA